MSTLFVFVRWTLVALAGSGLAANAAAQPVCAARDRLAPTRELHYVVNARVRPLLFWVGRDNVGSGRIVWSRASQAERIELLVGSDPARTPIRVNRWGYIAETVCAAGADLIGVMTESDETTADQASTSVSRAGSTRQAFRSIRSRISSGRSEANVARLSLDQRLTYREIDTLLPLVLDATGETRGIAVDPDIQPGFLMAVAALAERAMAAAGAGPRGRLALAYVYNGQVFDLQLGSARKQGQQVETEFHTRNRLTGATTRFSVWFESMADAPTPTRIRFRPRWWFEAELVLDRQATISAAANLARKAQR
jgi:hypothetical protein